MGFRSLIQNSRQSNLNEQKILENKLKLAEEDVVGIKKERDEERGRLQDELTFALSEGKKSQLILSKQFEEAQKKVLESEDKLAKQMANQEKEAELSDKRII